MGLLTSTQKLGGIIGLYFFKYDAGHNCVRHQTLITISIPSKKHESLYVKTEAQFDVQLISRFGPDNWPPRSVDLNPRLFSLRVH